MRLPRSAKLSRQIFIVAHTNFQLNFKKLITSTTTTQNTLIRSENSFVPIRKLFSSLVKYFQLPNSTSLWLLKLLPSRLKLFLNPNFPFVHAQRTFRLSSQSSFYCFNSNAKDWHSRLGRTFIFWFVSAEWKLCKTHHNVANSIMPPSMQDLSCVNVFLSFICFAQTFLFIFFLYF